MEYELTNGTCSRRSYISSAPLLQSDSASVNKSSIREPSIHQSISGGLERPRRQLSGWKIGVMVCAVTAATVGLLNISLTIWAVTNHKLIDGISYLYTGSCSEVASMSLWIHLGINAMSTMLLSASNCKLLHKTKTIEIKKRKLNRDRYDASHKQPNSKRSEQSTCGVKMA